MNVIQSLSEILQLPKGTLVYGQCGPLHEQDWDARYLPKIFVWVVGEITSLTDDNSKYVALWHFNQINSAISLRDFNVIPNDYNNHRLICDIDPSTQCFNPFKDMHPPLAVFNQLITFNRYDFNALMKKERLKEYHL